MIQELSLALKSAEIYTVEFENGLQISGKIDDFIMHDQMVVFIKTLGPTQLAFQNKEIEGHSVSYHIHGYSSPLGSFRSKLPLVINKQNELIFESGFVVSGRILKILELSPKAQIYTFSEATVKYSDTIYFEPSWGEFDLIVAHDIQHVKLGPADAAQFHKEN